MATGGFGANPEMIEKYHPQASATGAGTGIPAVMAPIFRADTLEELAAAIQVDAGGLLGTVERYNNDVTSGSDTAFFKVQGLQSITSPHKRPLLPPAWHRSTSLIVESSQFDL